MRKPCSRCGQPTYGDRHPSVDACLAAALDANRNLKAALLERDAVLKHLATDRPEVIAIPMHA
jgi:hypothetical protein